MSVQLNPSKEEVRASRDLRESGSSTVLTIPPSVLDSLDLEGGDTIEIVADWGTEEITLKADSSSSE